MTPARLRSARGLRVSAEMLWTHKLRTILSLLGIVVGISTLSVMTAVGRGSEQKILDGIQRTGSNLIAVNAGTVNLIAGRPRQNAVVTSLMPDDAPAIQAGAEDLVSFVAPAQSKSLTVKFENLSAKTSIVGTSQDILPIRRLRIETGDMFDDEDERASRRVAIVGQTVVQHLFGGARPLGQTIRIANIPFEVIGTLARAGADMNGNDQDDQILIPLRTALRRVFNVIYINTIYVQARSERQMDACAARLREILRERHRLGTIKPDDFTIQNQAELVRAAEETHRTFMTLTLSVASLSLLVGGVGILAVMLMSVRERVREIGLRRALGATRRDILVQFLMEATMLSLSGGLLGVVAGTVVTFAVAWVADWPAILAFREVSISVACSATIGLLFGTLPARKAAAAAPVAALRAE
jgi:putative ABC transport system permease protein